MSDLYPPDDTVAAVQRAIQWAARAHQHQTRKDGKTPYVAHPMRVLFTVRHVFEISDEVALCAAALHDTIEDTQMDYDDILEGFGPEVADSVAALTKDMRKPEAEREVAYDQGLTQASWQARAVKLADVYDNVCDAQDSAMRLKAMKKAERALDCASDASELSRAIAKVRELIQPQ